jgi:hypothetical protein
MNNVAKQLQKPFEEADIQWRVQQAGVSAKGNPYVMAIPYISNRAIQKRLDEVFGPFGWENAYKPTPDGKGYLCGITIHNEERSVTKWDGGEYTNIESLKGALSDSMKRSAVQLGIGRYLYDLDMQFAKCERVGSQREADNCHIHYPNKGNKNDKVFISWSNPALPSWAVPFDDYEHFIKPIKNAPDLNQLRLSYQSAFRAAESSQNSELMTDATKAKDERKAFILQYLEEINESKKRVVEDWLVKEIQIFSKLPSKSNLKNYYENVNEKLKTQISALEISCDDLIEVLAAAFDQRSQELTR